MSGTIKRAFFLFIPPRRTRNPVFLAPLVDDRVVRVVNEGPWVVGVTRSVSADGIHFTILPGVTWIKPGRHRHIHLPTSAVFVKLGITAPKGPSRVILIWRQRLIRFLVNAI